MPVIIGGSGTANGITSFSSGATFLSTLGVTGALNTTSAISASNGIAFPATQVASSDANTLDDYEEGTWTPVVTPESGSLTAYTTVARYIKIGKLVWIYTRIGITTAGTASGALNFSGVPFICDTTGQLPSLVREEASSGLIYQSILIQGGTTGKLLTTSNGGISWTNGYVYAFVACYPSNN